MVRLTLRVNAPVRTRGPILLECRRPPPYRLVDAAVVFGLFPDVGGSRLFLNEASAPAAIRRVLEAAQPHVDLVHERRGIALGAEASVVGFVRPRERPVMIGDVAFHPG